MATSAEQSAGGVRGVTKSPDDRSREPSADSTNHDHPLPRGAVDNLPGAGLVQSDADVSTHEGGPGRNAPNAYLSAPGAERPGTTEGMAARSANGGIRDGLGDIEAPSAQGQTAYAPRTGGTGAPEPGPSGILATSDPNFSAQHADEEGTPTPEALAEQKARMKPNAKPKR